jgi:hypothetical protein
LSTNQARSGPKLARVGEWIQTMCSHMTSPISGTAAAASVTIRLVGTE